MGLSLAAPYCAPGEVRSGPCHPPAAPVTEAMPRWVPRPHTLPPSMYPFPLPRKPRQHQTAGPQAIIYSPFQQGSFACRTPGQEEKERTIPFGDALMMPPETLGLIFPGPGPLPLLLVRGSLLGSSPMGTSCGGSGGGGEEEEGSKTKSERDVVTRPCCAPRYILPFANQTDSYFLWLNFGFPSAHWIHLSVI